MNVSIKLFEHNQSAYESVLEMLSDEGKAAVVHPTGTGKSYIGFKLCEQFPEKIICWLSPSEYIFNTQLENLKQDSDGWQPENITFFTYAKLMLMTDSELADIKPDYIVLDEFHRCGAEMWGDGVNRLLEMYPDELNDLHLDYTNYFTYIDTRNGRCVVCQRGHNKQKRTDLRQFSLAPYTENEGGKQLAETAGNRAGSKFSGDIPETRCAVQRKARIAAAGFIEPCAGIGECTDKRHAHAVEFAVKAAVLQDQQLYNHRAQKRQREYCPMQIAEQAVHIYTP